VERFRNFVGRSIVDRHGVRLPDEGNARPCWTGVVEDHVGPSWSRDTHAPWGFTAVDPSPQRLPDPVEGVSLIVERDTALAVTVSQPDRRDVFAVEPSRFPGRLVRHVRRRSVVPIGPMCREICNLTPNPLILRPRGAAHPVVVPTSGPTPMVRKDEDGLVSDEFSDALGVPIAPRVAEVVGLPLSRDGVLVAVPWRICVAMAFSHPRRRDLVTPVVHDGVVVRFVCAPAR
jgi:hypothetical protein